MSEARATIAIGLFNYGSEMSIHCLRKICKFVSLNGSANILSSFAMAIISESLELTRGILYRDKP
jgi:hypothetical protein